MRGAGLRRSPRNTVGRRHVDGIKILPAALVEDAGQIDDRVRAQRRPRRTDSSFRTLAWTGTDLANTATRAQETGELRPPRRNTDAVALLREPLDDMAPENPVPPKIVTIRKSAPLARPRR